MTDAGRRLLLWSPRLLGIAVAMFVGLFALDAIGQGAAALLVHAAPALVLLLAVAVSWRREWIGGAVFIAVAVLHADAALPRVDWILVVSGPLLLVGVLFLWSWRSRVAVGRSHPRA
jgi:hypothetical protein